MENLKKRPSPHRAAIEGDGGAPKLVPSVMGVFARVVPRAYNVVASQFAHTALCCHALRAAMLPEANYDSRVKNSKRSGGIG